MKVQSFSNSSLGRIIKKQNFNSNPITQEKKDTKNANPPSTKTAEKTLLVTSGLALITAGSVIYLLSKGKTKPQTIVNSYKNKLAEGLSQYLQKPISSEDLSSVITKEEFLKQSKTFTPENFQATQDNIKKGLYQIDLNISNNSSGKSGTISELLDKVVNYANELHKKTNKKFTFAITDNNNIDGVKEVLSIIAQNPQKFKNTQFIPAVKIDFINYADKTTTQTMPAEFLVYGINPFSKTINEFLNNNKTNKNNLITEYISDLKKIVPNVNFSEKEFNEVYLNNNQILAPGLNHKLQNYAQTKFAIDKIAKREQKNPEELYSTIIRNLPEENRTIAGLKQTEKIPYQHKNPKEIIELSQKYISTVNPDGSLNSKYENTFEDIIKIFNNEKTDTFLSISQPANYSNYIQNNEILISQWVKNSNELILGYDGIYKNPKNNIDDSVFKSVNEYCKNNNLLLIGGNNFDISSFPTP